MTEVTNSIIAAIEKIVQKRINQLPADRTIQATIIKLQDTNLNKYTVSYQGGTMPAYAPQGYNYQSGDNVYVLVPQGDFSNQKIIIMKSY